MRTDTLYGIVGRADTQETVERIYQTKGRNPSKSPIVLIGDISQMFDTYDAETILQLKSLWPGPNSIILPSTAAPAWIRRDNDSVAYRLPNNLHLRSLLLNTGPLIAPSANPEGAPPAATIDQAHNYFDEQVDHYEDGGPATSPRPSRIFQYNIEASSLTRLR